jgi:hypothetical protein
MTSDPRLDAHVMTNGTESRTRSCLYSAARINSTGTHSFMTLEPQQVIAASHYVVLPITDIVLKTANGWVAKNKIHTALDPTFIIYGLDITANAPDDEPS